MKCDVFLLFSVFFFFNVEHNLHTRDEAWVNKNLFFGLSSVLLITSVQQSTCTCESVLSVFDRSFTFFKILFRINGLFCK